MKNVYRTGTQKQNAIQDIALASSPQVVCGVSKMVNVSGLDYTSSCLSNRPKLSTKLSLSLSVTEEVLQSVLDDCENINLSQTPLQSQTSLNTSVVQSNTPNVVLEGLRPGTGYVVQVRARTVAGYGAYSKDMLFQTLTDGKWVAGWLDCMGG